jgi:rod shape-determining protein MreC
LKGTLAIILAILVLTVSFLLFTDIGFFVRGYVKSKVHLADAVGPVLKVMSAPVHSVNYLFESYINLVGVKRRSGEMKKKLDTLLLENQKIPELEKENERLKGLLRFMEQRPNSMIAARVVGEDVTNWFKCIMIDKGRSYGVREKMPVITPAGIVGQAVEVNQWHTKVMVINDTNSAVDVYVSGRQSRGILEGTGQTILKLKYVLKNDELEVGDSLITSGKDSIYPRGISAGIVISINKNRAGLFADVDVMPFNNFKKLDEVLVVKTW